MEKINNPLTFEDIAAQIDEVVVKCKGASTLNVMNALTFSLCKVIVSDLDSVHFKKELAIDNINFNVDNFIKILNEEKEKWKMLKV